MFYLRLLPSSMFGYPFRGNSAYQKSPNGRTLQISGLLTFDDLLSETVNVDWMEQRSHFPGLDWNGVEHLKVTGGCVINADTYGFCKTSYRSKSEPSGAAWRTPLILWKDGKDTIFVPVRVGATVSYSQYTDDGRKVVHFVWAARKRGENVEVAGMYLYMELQFPTDPKQRRWRTWGHTEDRNGLWYIPELYTPGPGEFQAPGPAFLGWNDSVDSSHSVNWYFQRSVNVVSQTRPYSFQAVKARIRWWMTQVVRASFIDELEQLEQLHASAFDSLQKFDGNLVMLLSKLPSMGTTTIQSVVDLVRSEGSLQDLASYWLANQYGDRLSVGGFTKLVKSLDKELFTIRTSSIRYLQGKSRTYNTVVLEFPNGESSFEITRAVQIAVKPKDYNSLMASVRKLYEWDAFPSMSNVWDAIPLSFVVDWFLNVGDIYRSVDRMVASRYYDVSCVMNSAKVTFTPPDLEGVTISYYRRDLSDRLQLSVDSIRCGLPSLVNCINGVALLLG